MYRVCFTDTYTGESSYFDLEGEVNPDKIIETIEAAFFDPPLERPPEDYKTSVISWFHHEGTNTRVFIASCKVMAFHGEVWMSFDPAHAPVGATRL